jgi:hypothetical protein
MPALSTCQKERDQRLGAFARFRTSRNYSLVSMVLNVAKVPLPAGATPLLQ